MAITTYDQLTAAIAGGERLRIYKPSMTAEAAGNFHSLWLADGRPSAGDVPSVGVNGEVLTKATAGAIAFTNPSGAATKYIAAANLMASTSGVSTLYDRLWQNSGVAFANGAVAISAPVALPARDENGSANGEGVFPWLEFYTTDTANTAASSGCTISYTNSDGVAGRTGTIQTIPATVTRGTVVPITLQAGDKGVRSIQSVTLANLGTPSGGTCGLVLAREIVELPLIANSGPAYGWDSASAKLKPDSCLAFRVLVSATNTGLLAGSLLAIEG